MIRLKLRHAMLGVVVVAELLAIYSMGYIVPKQMFVADSREKLVDLHDTRAFSRRNYAIRESLSSEVSAELAEKWARRGRADLADYHRQAAAYHAEMAASFRELAAYSQRRAAGLAAVVDLDPSAERATDKLREMQEFSDDQPLRDTYARVIVPWSSKLPEEDLPRWEEVTSKAHKMAETYRGSPGSSTR